MESGSLGDTLLIEDIDHAGLELLSIAEADRLGGNFAPNTPEALRQEDSGIPHMLQDTLVGTSPCVAYIIHKGSDAHRTIPWTFMDPLEDAMQ